jgi:ornithine cyclodeaminase/alanine dehydrogenase-like protein (mu-crystallin family)
VPGQEKPIDVLLLSRSDVVGLALAPGEVVSVVEGALREHAAGTYEMHPKIGVHPTGTDPANFIHAMPAYLRGLGACGLKWVAGFARNYELDLPNVTGLQVLNDSSTGILLSVMDCSYLTGCGRQP